MLLHRDGMIELNYDPATDVLIIKWPDISGLSRSALAYSFTKLQETISHYDIKKLLIDSRHNKVLVEEEEYTELMRSVHEQLRSTRLLKTARVGSLDEAREPKAEKHAYRLIDQLKPGFTFRNFRDQHQAMLWLQAD